MEETKLLNQPVYTKNTQLAGALSALGVPFAEPYFTKISDNGKITITWMFKPKSKCGKYNTKQLIDHWYDDDWYAENYPKGHPLALIQTALSAKEYLVDKIKDVTPYHRIKQGNKNWYVQEGTPVHKRLTKS